MPRGRRPDGARRDVPRARQTAAALDAARRAIVSCERCPRLREYCALIGQTRRRAYRDDTYWARPVPGFGDPQARILIVGLAPAAHGANRTGRVFTGDGVGGSGDFLMAALHRAGLANIPTSQHPSDGLALRDVFIAAAVRCAPPANKPTPGEVAACRPHLDAEMDALPNVRVVIGLGRIAFDVCVRLLAERARLNTTRRPAGPEARKKAKEKKPHFGHASVDVVAGGYTLVGCYHPSRQNTHTGRLTAPMMDEAFRAAIRSLGAS